MSSKRVDLKKILADSDLRRKLMVSTIQATQAREGIQTTVAQANRAYYVVTEGKRRPSSTWRDSSQEKGLVIVGMRCLYERSSATMTKCALMSHEEISRLSKERH